MSVDRQSRNILNVKDLPEIDLQIHKNEGGNIMDEQDHLDNLKYLRLLNFNAEGLNINDILKQ